MNQIDRVRSAKRMIASIDDAYRATAQSRTDFQLLHYVIRQHDPESIEWTPRQWLQCVIEMHSVHQGIEQAIVTRDRARCDIIDIYARWCFTANAEARRELDAREQRNTVKAQQHRIDGLLDQFETLTRIFEAMPKYDAAALEEDEARYWRARLIRQAHDQVLGDRFGGKGNIQAIRQAGVPLVDALADMGASITGIEAESLGLIQGEQKEPSEELKGTMRRQIEYAAEQSGWTDEEKALALSGWEAK